MKWRGVRCAAPLVRVSIVAAIIAVLCPSGAGAWSSGPDFPPADDPAALMAWMAALRDESPKEIPEPNPESMFGPTNINGVAGNGRLAAGFSRQGELTVLRWPTPSNYDHMSYLTSDFYAPRMGAPVNDG